LMLNFYNKKTFHHRALRDTEAALTKKGKAKILILKK
jgi:hypothetical protein